MIESLRFELEPLPLNAGSRKAGAAGPAEPCVRWEITGDPGQLGIEQFLVIIVDENHGRQRRDKEVARQEVPLPTNGRREVHLYIEDELPKGSVCRVEVCAVGGEGLELDRQWVRFVLEATFQPGTDVGREHLEACTQPLLPHLEAFHEKANRGPTFLVLGKQHHGKSSIINHVVRWLQRRTDVLNTVRVAPPGDLDCTAFTQLIQIQVAGEEKGSPTYGVELVDVPAFATMNEERKKDLRTLLWSKPNDWGRGEGVSFWTAKNPPDGVVVAVSLLSWRDERDALKDYLKVLTEELQHRRERFPYVILATQKDKFFLEEGNCQKDPQMCLHLALEDLKKIGNTEQVFAVSNYKRNSWWVPSVDEAMSTAFQQLTSDTTHRLSSQTRKTTGSAAAIIFVGVIAMLAMIASRK